MANLNAKIYLIASLLILLMSGVNAQDILYMQGGGRLECLVSDTQGGKVKYKMWQNRRGPDYVVPQDRVLMLFYQGGRYTLFSASLPGGMQSFEPNSGNDRIILRDGSALPCKLERRTPESLVYLDNSGNRQNTPLSDILLIFFSDGQHELTGSAEQAARILESIHTSPTPATTPSIIQEPETTNLVNPTETGNPAAEIVPEPEPQPEPIVAQPDPQAEDSEKIEEIAETPSVEEIAEETATVTDSPTGSPDNGGSEISHIDMNEYKAKALDRTRNLGQYFSIIADKATNWQDANDAIDLAVALFVGEHATVEVSSAGAPEKKLYPIRQYLERLKLLKYDRVDITWSDIVYVSDLKKGVDGNYYGIISFVQKFTGYRDGQPVYSDYTRKNIEIVLKGYTKQVGGQTRELWDVFLSDIGVVNTRKG